MTPLTALVGRISVLHTPCMKVCNTPSGARRLTGPIGVGHFGETSFFTVFAVFRYYFYLCTQKGIKYGANQ